MNRARMLFAAAMLAILILAAAFRLPRLSQRPMHADEANQAVKAGRLYATGEYEYDVTDHHGPSLYWLTLPSLAISGAKSLADSQEVEYRIVPVVFGLGLIPLLMLFADGLGRTAVAAAALLTAISPVMIFYSRYYIQETLLVFFTLAALGCGWQYVRARRLPWILAAGAAVGMMYATKETWILAAAAAIGAAALTWGWSWRKQGAGSKEQGGKSSASGSVVGDPYSQLRAPCSLLPASLHVLAALLTACLVATALFSMFGRHWNGPWESISAYANYFRRGSQQGEHSEAWYYYLKILFAYWPSRRIFWSEGFIALLAIVGGIHSLAGREVAEGRREAPPTSPALPCFLTFYTVLLTLLYSLISYKTPWCALSFLMGMVLMAGIGAAAIFRFLCGPSQPEAQASGRCMSSRLRVGLVSAMAAIVLAAGASHLGWQAYQLSFNPRFMADPLNPYVYAHTPTTLPKLALQLDRMAQRVPDGHDLAIQVVVPENYWPLPWYLRKFNQDRVGYWLDPAAWKQERDHFPPPAILILSSEVDGAELATHSYEGPVSCSLRPGVLVFVYFRKDLWPAYLECQAD